MMTARRFMHTSHGALAGFCLLALSAGACSDTQTPAAPSSATAVDSALQGDSSLGAQIAAVREATARYHDVGVAMAAGYPDPSTRVCDEIPAGGMGIHSGNPALMTSNVDPLEPEVLLYEPKSGGFRLVGVEYIQFVFLRNPATGVVAPWTDPGPWPSNYQVVTPTPQLFGQTFQGPMPGHFPGMPWHWDLHAWIWANNPSGMFALWNPTVHCQ